MSNVWKKLFGINNKNVEINPNIDLQNNNNKKINIKSYNSTITINTTSLNLDINKKLNADLLQKEIQEKYVYNLEIPNQEKKIKAISSIQHLKQLYEIGEFTKFSSKEVFDIIKSNDLLDKMIESQDYNERTKIIQNLDFLEKSTKEEKIILVWLTLFVIFAKFKTGKDLIKSIDFYDSNNFLEKVRISYDLRNINGRVRALRSQGFFASYGVLYDSIRVTTFDKNAFQNSSWMFALSPQEKNIFTLEYIYKNIPEIDLIANDFLNTKKEFNLASEIGSPIINFTKTIINLELAAALLLKEIDEKKFEELFKDIF